MNNFLDIRTVLFSSIVTSALCAVVMNSLWRQNRRRSPELAYWQADFILQFAAILLIALRGILPDVISMLLGVPCILLGALLMLIGLERYTGKTSTPRYNFILLAIFTLVHGYFIYAQPSLLARNINQSLGLLVFCGQCAWLLLRRADSEMRPYTRMLGLIFIAYSLVSLVRIFVDLIMPRQNDLFKSGLYDTLAILIYQMLFIGLTFALFLMVNRRLFSELERDIAERKMAEAALKISEEKFSVAFQNTPDALVITLLPDGKIIEVNESFFRMSGFSKAESLGRTTVELKLWGNLVDRNQMVETLRQQHRVLNVETDFRKKSGDLFRGLISGELIQLQGQTCVLNVIHDITERKRAEETIRSLARFPSENPNPVLRITQDGKLLYVNEAAFTQLKDWKLEKGAPAPEALKNLSREIFETQTAKTVEIPCGGRTFSITFAPMKEDKYVNLYGHDITERKQADEKLIASEASYRRLFEAAKDGILILDAKTGIVTDVNPFLVEKLGFPRKEILGKELWQLGFLKDIVANKANFLELQRKEYISYEDLPMETATGQLLNVEFVSNVYHVNHHKVIQCNIRDLTERKRVEEALRESEDKFKYVFENSVVGNSITQFNGGMQVNQALCDMLGYSMQEMQEKRWQEITHPDDIALTQKEIDTLLSGEKEWVRFVKRFLHKNGAIVWVDLSSSIRRDGQRKPLYLMSSVIDITERKRAEEYLWSYSGKLQTEVEQRTRELRNAQEKLVRQERLAVLGQLAGSIGHELRNPLGVISNAIYFLKMAQPDVNDTVKEYLNIIENETRTSNKIVTDLLEFTRNKSVEREPASVSELIRQTLERYPVPPSVKVEIKVPKNLPPVYADPQQIVQVLGNLVANASQAMPKIGQLTLSARIQANMIVIAAQDTGIGISTENMGKVFEPLFTTKTKGIGLGLAVSRKLAEANGGRIEVQSKLGKGSTFTLYLPVYRS